MNKCKIEWKDDEHVSISGVIDEAVHFEDMVGRMGKRVWIDFSGATRINSCGVRQWTQAIHNARCELRFTNVPSLIVDQFSMVPEFLGSNSVVESFQGRYVCESCGNEETTLLHVGRDIQTGQNDYGEGPARHCGKCGACMEFDHNPDIYFDFLRTLKPAS